MDEETRRMFQAADDLANGLSRRAADVRGQATRHALHGEPLTSDAERQTAIRSLCMTAGVLDAAVVLIREVARLGRSLDQGGARG